MSSLASAIIKFSLSWTCTDVSNPLANRALSGVYPTPAAVVNLPSGSAANQMDALYVGQITVPATGSATLNLTTAADPNTNVPAFVKVLAFVFKNNDTNGAKIVVGGGSQPMDIGVRAAGGGIVTNKVLTSNVATLTVAAHGLVVGQKVNVIGVDSTFNGSFTITVVGDANNFSYAKTHADVPTAAATGNVNVTAGTIDVWPGALPTILQKNDATGFTVTASTADTLTFTNASANIIVMDVLVFGRKE